MRIVIDNVGHIKHYGVKGQQWGVRRKLSRQKLTPEQHRTRNAAVVESMKPLQRMHAGAAASIGSAFVAKKLGVQSPLLSSVIGASVGVTTILLMQKNQNKKMSEIGSV